MSIQKGKHPGGQTQGYPQQRYPHAPYIARPTTPQRPEVGFHVPGAGFSQQQGGGAGPPQPQLRGIHHPHHGGNPSIPPQQPPPQAQSQHTGGPPGPAPTSTPPGPAEMGKQGPPHMQGQPQMQQGGQVQVSFIPNQRGATNSQAFFGNPRGPAPRISNHRNPVVNMQPTNVGQQMFPQHVNVPVPPMQMYGQQVMPTQIQATPHMFVQSQLPVFGNQTRHPNHTTSGYYNQSPQQVMMAPSLYQGFAHSQPTPYYFQSPVGIRSGGGVTGAPGPGGLASAPSQQVITGGGPPTQLGQPGGPVTMGIVQGPVGVAGLSTGDSNAGQSASSVTTGKQARRKHALDIIDPKTMKNIDIYEGSATSSSTPPRSGESSARDTPQPNTGSGAMDVAAEFAARVAAVASEKSNPPPPPPPTVTPAYVESSLTTNGPDPSGTNSIPTSEGDVPSLSKQQIVVVEENVTAMAPPTISPVAGTPTTWKQVPLTSTSLGSKPSGNSSKSDISNQAVADEKVIEAEPQTAEFVLSVSVSDTKVTPAKDLEVTPVVSAQINAPAVEVVRNNREQFPALKTSVPSAHQSPRRKQQTQMQRPETASNVPQSTSVAQSPSVQPALPSVSRETTPTVDVKVSKKPTLMEESAPPSSTFPVSQPPKEKRDQEKPHGRDREKSSSISSQGRGEREKSVSSTSSSSSTGRDREKSSRDKDKAKDRDKSASQGRDRDKSSTKEATSVPVQPQVEQPSSAEEPKQQANGEMTASETTDSKASQRSKQKQRNKNMRELNRKGAEKEGGTDMDAFVESTPGEVAPPVLPAPAQIPTSVVVSTNKITDNQIVKDEDIETDKEEKLVAARNEENAKVSAAALKEDATSSSTPVIENIPTAKPTTLTLRHTYKEDQWSPLNPEGKKKYERDFLMELQNDPQSKKKPDNLPDIDVVLKDNTNRRLADRPFSNMNRPIPERSAHENFTPSFMRTPNQRGQATVTKRNSQQGKPKGKQMGIHISLSLKEEVKLHETENAWKPTRMKSNANNEDAAKSEDLYKKVRGVLNKLTPQKFTTLVSQVQSLPIDNSERLQGVINLVFEKAVDEPSFSVAYAGMCKILAGMQVPGEQQENVNFRKLLVNRCQLEFEKSTDLELNRQAKLKEMEESTDQEKKKELQLFFDDEERRIRMKSVGNVRFIGELFKLGMLTTNIMLRCIRQLLSSGYEESLECLCKLLTTIGKDLEHKNQDLSPFFERMKDISHKRGEVSSRVRFMLQDVIDLRQNKWVPRRDDSNPKTMDQIQKEAEKEVLETQMILNSAPQTPRRQDERAPSSRKSRGGCMGEDGWNTVASTSRANRYTVDASKFKATKDDGGVSLGGSHLFSNWSMGASAKSKDSNKKPLAGGGSGGGSSYNMYAALDTSNDDGKRPAPPMSSSRPGPGKTTPSPSMEKERMLQPFRSAAEGDNRKARGASRSSSRDNSARGGGNEDSTSLRPYAPTSQPPSMSASTEDISGTSTNSSSKTPAAPATVPMNIDEIRKKTSNLLGEFLCNSNFKESEALVLDTFSQDIHSVFVRESLNEMLEKKPTAREKVGLLMSHLVQSNTISLSSYIAGLNEFLECADDIAIDVPKIWTYTAELFVPMLLSEALSFYDFRDVAHQPHGELISAVLDLLVKDKGPGWIREKWHAAHLQWTDFIPPDQVDNFVKKNKLEYVLGGAPSAPSPSSSIKISWDVVQKKLEQFLKSEQDSSTSFDRICEWIAANVGDQVKEPQFIRALMTAICLSAIDSQKWKLNDRYFLQQQKLVMKYVDNKEELELQCLYAVQSLITELEHPQGLLCQIFQLLWEDGLISPDSFITWQDSTDPLEQGGKGVALKSLTTFFTALREGDDDSSCDES